MHILKKLKEVIVAVIPISLFVILLHFTITPMPYDVLYKYIFGTIILVLGLALFLLGTEIGVLPIGEKVGSALSQTRKLNVIIIFGFLIGIMITIAEPNVQVLAEQITSVSNQITKNLLIPIVAIGVGIFVILGLIRIVFEIPLSKVFIITYSIIFVFAFFSSPNFLSVAFDSGGVTTGPMVVPFLLALGIGLSSVRGNNKSTEDSFGLVAFASIGPILAVLFLGIIFRGGDSSDIFDIGYSEPANNILEVIRVFVQHMPKEIRGVSFAILPMIIMFVIFQIFFLKLPKNQVLKMVIGIGYTFVGLVLFLTGANVGFMPAGSFLGNAVANLDYNWILVPIGMVLGFSIVLAEPSIRVLNAQVEEVSGGYIKQKLMLYTLCIGIGFAVGLAMIRVLTGLNFWYFLVPGYFSALMLTKYSPPLFTAIAFDSGTVASGPMAATFILPFTLGACNSSSVVGNPLTHAFGVVALVSLIPIIVIQLLGIVYNKLASKTEAQINVEEQDTEIEIL